ncbi:DNA repair protein RecN [Methylomarinovum tepidoasis]|uniref:DNA repair protein RecN n=1 Tax=Methylomarinovum tepidoasis TaxID=2840183 RepID=A0AAU9CCT3_9GAMM|nr:DNA repair protein RecN [Methylomarinovum sp. IN45]BCX88606.1 DNA repair protein RecN [Methylomarinovum sp. IN45]
MLTTLSIRDLAVVRQLDLELESGFTALTGETGAGKSILLTALGLALGEKADTDRVRSGAERAEVILEFDLTRAPEAARWLEDNDLAAGDTCLIRRTLAVKGRSRAYVNDRPVTLQTLQALGHTLVEIHGQHAHLRLCQPGAQRRLLDRHGGSEALAAEVAERYRRWKACHDRLQALRQRSGDQALREDFLRFQIEELEAAQVEDLDYEALVAEHTRLANLDRILTTLQAQVYELYEAEGAVGERLDRAVREMETLCQWAPELGEALELLRSAQIQLDEAGHSLRQQRDGLEADPQRLAELDARLGQLHDLARKHQVKPGELPAHLEAMRAELHALTHQEQQVAELEAQLQVLEQDYRRKAAELSARRQRHATALSDRITGLMRELGMPHGEFSIHVSSEPEAEPRPEGLDWIAFLVTTNPGLPPRPLAKVASGGELSRLSLAIQVACNETRPVPTLVFDEVDTGIGGGVAQIVGRRLRELGGDRQILCVTHLPQVAAQAHHHLQVRKRVRGGRSETEVTLLRGKQRREEIARMLGGLEITPQTLAHAEEMLQWNR